MKKIFTICLVACFPLLSNAQTDTVWVEGRVTDATTRQPEPICEVQFLQDNESKAVAFCDEQGYYSIGWMPAGTYTLSVISSGKSLYCAELQIVENAMVNIALMHDTMKYRTLNTVVVSETKHYLGSRLITSPDDPRLWNFNGNPILSDIGPASEDLSTLCNIGKPRKIYYYQNRRAWLNSPWPKKTNSKKKKKISSP